MDQDIKLIIKEEISLLLTAGDKIVTKNEEIILVAGFLCKGNKRRLPVRKRNKAFALTIAFSNPQCPAKRYEAVPACL